MGFNWSQHRKIAIALEAAHPDIDPRYLNYADLHAWVCALDGFEDDPDVVGEQALGAIQTAWIEERE